MSASAATFRSDSSESGDGRPEFWDDCLPYGGPTRFVPLSGDLSQRLGSWDHSRANLDYQQSVLGVQALGMNLSANMRLGQLSPVDVPFDWLSNALLRVHNTGYVAARILPVGEIIYNMTLHNLMEPFLLVDEHQVIISISTIWLTVLIALDGTGASRTSFQDPTTLHTLPDELESQVGIPGFLNRLQGSPTLGYYRRSWIPTTHRTISLTLTITSDASVIMHTSFTGRAHWRWYLGPTLPVSFPRRRISWPDREYAELRRTMRLWPSPWRYPLPWPSRIHYISVMDTPLISANHFIYDIPQPPEWTLTGQMDVTPPAGMGLHRLLPFSLPFSMTALDKNFLWGLRRDALTARNLAPVEQLAYVTVTDATELEWAWVRVGNDAYSVDSLSLFFYPLRCVTFAQLVSPFLTLPGGRYKILIVGPGSATLITVLLPPTLASPDAARGNQRDPPLHRTVS